MAGVDRDAVGPVSWISKSNGFNDGCAHMVDRSRTSCASPAGKRYGRSRPRGNISRRMSVTCSPEGKSGHRRHRWRVRVDRLRVLWSDPAHIPTGKCRTVAVLTKPEDLRVHVP